MEKIVFKGNGYGVAEIENTIAKIKIRPTKGVCADECFECFASADGRLVSLGELCKNCATLNMPDKTNALIIARKNRLTGGCTVEMWGECRINSEEFFEPGAKLKKSEKASIAFDKNTVFSFDNFLNMNFSWRKINGYVIPCSYKIMRYVMSSENVYRCVNSRGYYMLGEAKEDGVHYIAAAVPVAKNRHEAFEEFKEKVCTIRDGKIGYKAVCMGIDESGEFFVYF